MPITDAATEGPLSEKLLYVASRSGGGEFDEHYSRLEEMHGREEIHRAADGLEQEGLIEWPDRETPSTLSATEAGHAAVARMV